MNQLCVLGAAPGVTWWFPDPGGSGAANPCQWILALAYLSQSWGAVSRLPFALPEILGDGAPFRETGAGAPARSSAASVPLSVVLSANGRAA